VKSPVQIGFYTGGDISRAITEFCRVRIRLVTIATGTLKSTM
jgi:hypothetical protein